METGFELTVLGIAQDGGLPHVGCFESCCRTAREQGVRLGPACLGIRNPATGHMLLVEATPDIEAQLAFWSAASGTQRTKTRPVDALLITHAHIGHYLGLAQLGREGAGSRGLPLYATPSLAAFLTHNAPWSQLVEQHQIEMTTVEPGTTFEPLPGLRAEALPVPHRDEFSDTVAFRFTGPTQTVLFVPDVDGWSKHPGLAERLLRSVDVAYVDGTFWDGRELPHRDIREVSHPLMTDTMELLQEFGKTRPGSVRFIHLNHSNPVINDFARQREVEARGFRVAKVGERVRL